MAKIEIEPLMVKGKDSEGVEVEVDAALILATDTSIRETFARGLQEMLNKGFALNQSISVGFIISEEFDDAGPSVVVFPEQHMDTYLPEYASNDYVAPGERTPAK